MASPSSSSATVAVEKATSDLLFCPDWTMNIDICDSVNSNHWLAKDVVKALKKRLQHKNPKVQILSLTLLETMVKNCGDYIHFQIAEKNILGEMVKTVKKKTDMHVRDKILVLLDSWQEAFGGPGGKHPQYYWAYEELRRSGVEFPQRSSNAAPIFTPPVSHSTLRPAQAGYGMPSNFSRRLDETMATEVEGLSSSTLESMRNAMELLNDMLQAVNPDDREAVKDEIIVDLVNHCRSNQKKLMQMLTTTGDEELLGQGLELNDSLQVLLAKHDAIASGSPIPAQATYLEPKPSSDSKSAAVNGSVPSSSNRTSMPVANVMSSYVDEEDEEDDFAQLARRHSKMQSIPSQSSNGTSQALVPVDTISATSTATVSEPAACNALALVDQPTPLSTMKEQEIIDLLNITLSTPPTSPQPHTSYTPATSNQNVPPAPASNTQGNPYVSQTYPGNQEQAQYNTYVVPWALPQSQHQCQMPSHTYTPQLQQPTLHQPQRQRQPHPQPHSLHQPPQQEQFQTQFQSPSRIQPDPQHQQQFQTQSQPLSHVQPHQQQQHQTQARPDLHTQQKLQPHQSHTEAQLQSQPQHQLHSGLQLQPQLQTQSQQFPRPQPQQQQQQAPQSQAQQQFQPESQAQFQPQSQQKYPQYTSGYVPPPWAATPGYASGQRQAANNVYSTTQASPNSSYTSPQVTRPMNNYNSSNSRGTNGSSMDGNQRVNSTPSGQKHFVPSYRLFEDLNVFGNSDGRFNVTGNAPASLSGPSSQGMVGGRK